MSEDDLLQRLQADADEHEFIMELGVVFDGYEDGVLHASVPYNDKYANPGMNGTIHGGIVVSILDTVMGHAFMGAVDGDPDTSIGPTITLSTNFVSEAQRRLAARAEVVRIGRSTAVLDGRLWTEDNRIVATAQGAWRVYRT